jgi:hypothetical protein
MNLNAILQPSFVLAHLACVAFLIIAGVVWSSKRCAEIFSAIAILTGGVASISLFVGLLGVVGAPSGPGIISPIVFAGGGLLCFGGYLFLFVLAWFLRPNPFKLDAPIFFLTLLGFGLLNGSFLLLPKAAATRVIIYVRDADSKPVSEAKLVYKSQFQEGSLSNSSDTDGRIILNIMHGATIDGRFEATQKYSELKLYIVAPGGRRRVWGIQRHWSLYFGSSDITVYNFFLSEFDDPIDHSIEIYLPSPNHPVVMPYSQLKNLTERLLKAQQSGEMFNLELNVQNLESYLQIVDVARAYDPSSPVRHYAQNIFTYLKLGNDELRGALKKLTAPNVAEEIRIRGLSRMRSTLGLPDTGLTSWQGLQAQIRGKLDADLAALNRVPKPVQ